MSIIVLVDGDYAMIDSSSLLRGSIEAVGETVNVSFHGVSRTAIYCEAGIPKKLAVELPKWRSGEKSVANQTKKDKKKTVLLANGKSVEITERPKREKKPSTPLSIPVIPPPKKAKISGKKAATVTAASANAAAPPQSDTVASPSGDNRNNVFDRGQKRRSPTPTLVESEDEDGDDTVHIRPQGSSGTDLSTVLAAVNTMGRRMESGMKAINENLEKMNRRIERLENQQDEIADTIETQRSMIREVASIAPVIAENAHKAASGTDTIAGMLPPPPPAFSYRYVSETKVRELDDANGDLLSFAAALDKEVFTRSERKESLHLRDKGKVQWLTECLLYRRRFSIGAGKKAWIREIRKRLNTYASRKRGEREGEIEEEMGEGVDQAAVPHDEQQNHEEQSMAGGEGARREEEGIGMNDDQEGMNVGRVGGGNEMNGYFAYLRDHEFD